MTSKGIDGRVAERVLDKVGISISRSTIPNDPNPPMKPSGIRLGTPAMTTRGVKEEEIKKIVGFIDSAIENREDDEKLTQIKKEVEGMCASFPLPTV